MESSKLAQRRLGLADWPENTVLGMLDEPQREAFLAAGQHKEYPTGASLLIEGDKTRHVMVLDGGWVKIVGVTNEGGQALLSLRSRGELIGEQAALEGTPRSASAIAISPVTAYVIQSADFMQFLDAHPDAALPVFRSLSAKLRWSTSRRVDFSGLSVKVRLARVLCELTKMYSTRTVDGVELGHHLTQSDFAAMIGTSEPSLQRAVSELRAEGVVATKYRRLVILDPRKLVAIADML